MPAAACLGHDHTCPMFEGLKPHRGGPVSAGSSDVSIGGRPAAHVGCVCTCVGPPDRIVTGSSSVTINGKPAARMGDSTAHGGVITQGDPSVEIG